MKLILPHLPYEDALSDLNLTPLKDCRKARCQKLCDQIKNPDHRLHALLPMERNIGYNLRGVRRYEPPPPSRADKRFMNWSLLNLQYW